MADAANSMRWLGTDSGPLIGLQLSVTRRPWRLGPAWAVVAAALASGAPIGTGEALLHLLGAIVLADAVWGGMWSLMASGQPLSRRGSGLSLPYAQPRAPAQRLARRLSELASGASCYELAAVALLAFGLAAMLGRAPVLLTVAVLACAILGQVLAERQHPPAFCYAMLAIGLPWLLGLTLSGEDVWLRPGPLLLGGPFVVLGWGAQMWRLSEHGGRLLLWLGQLVAVVVLAVMRLPWAAGFVATLCLAPTWWALQAPTAEKLHGGLQWAILAVNRCEVWWWLAMVASAVALRAALWW